MNDTVSIRSIINELSHIKSAIVKLTDHLNEIRSQEEALANEICKFFGFTSYYDVRYKSRKYENIMALKWCCVCLYAHYRVSLS